MAMVLAAGLEANTPAFALSAKTMIPCENCTPDTKFGKPENYENLSRTRRKRRLSALFDAEHFLMLQVQLPPMPASICLALPR